MRRSKEVESAESSTIVAFADVRERELKQNAQTMVPTPAQLDEQDQD